MIIYVLMNFSVNATTLYWMMYVKVLDLAREWMQKNPIKHLSGWVFYVWVIE